MQKFLNGTIFPFLAYLLTLLPKLMIVDSLNLHINANNMQYVNVENVHWNANIVGILYKYMYILLKINSYKTKYI